MARLTRSPGSSATGERAWAAVLAVAYLVGPCEEARGARRPKNGRGAAGPTGREEKGEKKNPFSFSFLIFQINFEIQIQINLKFDFKPHNSKIICNSMNA